MGIGLIAHWPAAFWLIVPLTVALILFRLYRTRRKEIVTGSLLLWRRLALHQPKTPPKRVIMDRSLLLQAAAMLALVAALAGPVLALGGRRGRGLLLLLDNAPPARAREADGTPLWARVQEKAQEVLRVLKPDDTVFLARSAPQPRLLAADGVRPGQAAALVAAQLPALSGPTAEQAWLFAVDAARHLSGDGPLAAVAVSPREGPASAAGTQAWLGVAPQATLPPNVGIVDFGALSVAREGKAEVQVLVRLRNFSSAAAQGTVRLEGLGNEGGVPAMVQPCSLAPGGEEAVVFSVPREPACPLRIAWARADGTPDALPEDDAIVAAPRLLSRPRVRFHAAVPALEQLYRVALNATFVPPDSAGPADLDVYAGSVPERAPENSRGIMLLSPEAGYRLVFDVSGKTLPWPRVQRDESDPLTRGIADKPGGVFPVPQARELLPTGDFKTLLKDAASQRALVARFVDEKQRPGFLLAFVPGAGFPAGRMLEPELAAVLVRAALLSAGAGEPLEARRAAEIERAGGEPSSLDWRADRDLAAGGGAGVLDERTSASVEHVARAGGQAFDTAALEPLARRQLFDLRPWLIVVAMLLAGMELWLEQRRGAGRKGQA